MPGIKGYSGRRKLPGRVHRLEIYYRFQPGEDPPEIEEVFELIRQHRGAARREILRALLTAGARAARRASWRHQEQDQAEVEGRLDDLLSEF